MARCGDTSIGGSLMAEARLRAISGAIAQAVRVLRALAAADRAAGFGESTRALEDEVAKFEAVAGATPGVAVLPPLNGDAEQLRAAKTEPEGEYLAPLRSNKGVRSK